MHPNDTGISEADALRWLAELFGESAAVLAPETVRSEIPTWDSLGVLTLMAALDERFGLIVNDADMRAMQKIGDILEFLRQNRKLS